LTPNEVAGADFLANFWATTCFLGVFMEVDFLAVCFVLAILNIINFKLREGVYSTTLLPIISVALIRPLGTNHRDSDSNFINSSKNGRPAHSKKHNPELNLLVFPSSFEVRLQNY
jgi:hypothetical protein